MENAQASNLQPRLWEDLGFSPYLNDTSTFNDWRELRIWLVNTYGLEDAVVRLQPDFLKGGDFDSYGSMETADISSESILLGLSIGYEVTLAIHLVRSESDVLSEHGWRPNSDFRGMLACAKAIFERSVRDDVVDLMSRKGDVQVVSFFLDDEGKVELASSNARSFCARFSRNEGGLEDYLPPSFWDYASHMHKRLSSGMGERGTESSLVYCYHFRGCILNCLLQRMGHSGSLLSIAIHQ